MKRITIEVTDEVHQALKMKTTFSGLTIRSVLTQLILNYLKDGKQKS